ncbi:hypothetical protein GQR58_005480 [Nymphon striatum]|nr:hypothetical protein GQR58_005480 [Nymphon striatum]
MDATDHKSYGIDATDHKSYGQGELPGTIPSYAPLFPHIPHEGVRGPTGDMTGLTGNCQLYRGSSVCTKLVGNNSVFVRPPNTISDLDRRQEVDDYTKKGIKYSSAHSKSTAILSVDNAS